jgi:hypothetical protein
MITFCLLILLGGPTVYSVIQEPVGESQPTDVTRGPANVNPAVRQTKGSHKGITSRSIVLDFSCEQKNLVQDVDGTLLRLRGTSCLKDNWKDLTVTNQTNGFTASIIYLKNKGFTTDFIDLKEGVNELNIQATDEKGQSVSQKLRVRRLPASTL